MVVVVRCQDIDTDPAGAGFIAATGEYAMFAVPAAGGNSCCSQSGW
jgi:hypothetical protein